MEWYYWLIIFCPVIASGTLGWFLDVKKGFSAPYVYWFFGIVSMMPAMFVAGVAL